MDEIGLPRHHIITQENDPIRWLQEMADTRGLQCMPYAAAHMIIDAAFNLGDTWPAPMGSLQVLAGYLHHAQTEGYGLSDETLDDLQEMYQFVVHAINRWNDWHPLEPVAVRTTEELAQDIFEHPDLDGMVSLEAVQDRMRYTPDCPSHERVVAAIEQLERDGLVWCLYDREGNLHGYRVNPCAFEPRGVGPDDDEPF